MKRLMIGAALVVAMAMPAFAQSYDPEMGTGNVRPSPEIPTGDTRGATYNPNGWDYNWNAGAADSYGYAYAPGYEYRAYPHHRPVREW